MNERQPAGVPADDANHKWMRRMEKIWGVAWGHMRGYWALAESEGL